MTDYTLEIFPDKPRPELGEKHQEIRLFFETQEIKSKYVKAEAAFTQEAFNEYLLANTNDKKDAQRNLDLKRITFAKQNNYYPKKGNKFVWAYDASDNGGDQPTRFA